MNTPLTAEEQHAELIDKQIVVREVRCENPKCNRGRGDTTPEVTCSFDDEAANVFANRLLEEGWQVYGKRMTLLCPACATEKGLNPVIV